MAGRVDALCESFRPGVVERLGIGPDAALARNPKLVYGRLTGWGEEGPLAHAAAHSLNYESLVGAIGSMGPAGGPPIPLLQVLGDFAGGGMHLAFGVVCALLEAQRSGTGQVVEVAMVDGVASIYTAVYAMARGGMQTDDIGTNLFDGGAPFYNVYETADAKFVSVAPLEPHFYAVLLDKLGLDPASLPDQYDRARWPELRDRFAAIFRTRTRDEWCSVARGHRRVLAPVMRLGEAADHPHNIARHVFVARRRRPPRGRARRRGSRARRARLGVVPLRRRRHRRRARRSRHRTRSGVGATRRRHDRLTGGDRAAAPRDRTRASRTPRPKVAANPCHRRLPGAGGPCSRRDRCRERAHDGEVIAVAGVVVRAEEVPGVRVGVGRCAGGADDRGERAERRLRPTDREHRGSGRAGPGTRVGDLQSERHVAPQPDASGSRRAQDSSDRR